MLLRRKLTPLVMILAATTLSAQETTGTVTGHVTGPAGKPVAGALVRVTSPSLLGERTATTSDTGQYRIPLLPNGRYAVVVSARGMITSRSQFQVLAGQTSRQDAALASAAEAMKVKEAIVEVLGDIAQMDKTTTLTTTSFSMDSLNEMASQSLNSMVSLAPGITGVLDPNTGGYGTDAISIRGGIQHSSKVIQNGMNVTEEGGGYMNETTTILDMVDTMAVIQSPLNARFGNTDGGLISIVTTRGSNDFGGSIRLKMKRNFWQDNNTSYQRRDGSAGDPVYPQDDGINRVYEVSLKGPIWKDRITFAYGSQITPSSRYSSPVGATTLSGLPNQATFTYMPGTPGNGIVPGNTYGLGALDSLSNQATFNQFVVFFQIHPDHSLEWSYTQNDSAAAWGIPRFGRIDAPSGPATDDYHHHLWNLGYKGIIGAGGILEARAGHTYRTWPHPYSPGMPPIWVTYLPSTLDTNGAHPAGSLLEAYSNGGTAYNINGFNADHGDTILNDSLVLNYSQLFSQGDSSHMVDVGFEQEKFQWGIQVGAAKDQYIVPGQNPTDGSFLVFNAATATIQDLDPTQAGNTASVLDNPVINPGVGAPGSDNHYPGGLGLVPQWIQRSGAEGGAFRKRTMAYYINDLWTFNSRHSLMVGLRYDSFKVDDDYGTMVSYGHLNPRFEYKWDVSGDQSRLVNLSYGQFQASSPGSVFLPAAHGRLGDQTTHYWSEGSATPHYVTYAQLMNPANYTVSSKSFSGETFQVDKDWKNPVSSEITLGFRRSSAGGAFWRATAVFKNWANLYDWFPGQVYTDQSGTQNFHRVLKNDDSYHRTYKSVELEWNLPLTRRFTLMGNYTFARMMANTRPSLDNPDRTTSQLANFRDYYATKFTLDQLQPYTQRTPDHNLNLYVACDLTTGKVKSNVTLRGAFVSGATESRWANYSIPYPTVPGYHDASNANTGGLPNGVSLPVDGGRMTNADLLTMGLKYNLEIPVWRSAKWFLDVDMINPFNTKTRGTYYLGGSSQADQAGLPGQYLAHGWRAATDLSTVGTGRIGGRSVSLDTGIRF
jgi:hypothetical protein